MLRILASLTLLASVAPVSAQPTPASLKTPPPALRLFERDWVLMNWALKHYDMNRDILIDPLEAQAAADAFRNLADANKDGRVTQDEYRSARQTILTRE